MTVLWKEISETDKEEIIKRVYENKEDVDNVAQAYGIKSSSLSRRLREIRGVEKEPGVQIVEHLVGDTNPGSNPNDRTLYINVEEPINVIVYSDLHAPFHDEKAVSAFLRAVKSLKHDLIIDGGDGADMYSLSRFGKNQITLYTKHVQKDFEGSHKFCERLNRVTNAKKIRILGNHFARYINWLNENTGVAWVPELQLDVLLRSDYFGWSLPVGSIYFNANQNNLDYPDPELIVHHGTLARKHSGNSSRGEAENFGYVSSISGHVHRLSVSYKRTMSGQILMAEAGTLRNLHPDYNVFPDWQNGFLYFTLVPGVGTFCMPILIIDGRAFLNGHEIS